MAGSTFQPPIHLDPNQDPGQQTAFINQNFQSLAAALETNSFRIVKSDSAIVTVPATPTPGAIYTSGNLTHNLGFIPAVLAFVQPSAAYNTYAGSTGYGGSNAELPWIATAYIASILSMGISFILDVSSVNSTFISFYATTSTAAGSPYAGDWTIRYYLLQETLT